MLRKITLLAMALGALVAFAIPAVASADTWTVDGNEPGHSTATGTTVDGTGTLSATLVAGTTPVELGPCLTHYTGIIWNETEGEETIAHGEITSFTIDAVHMVGGVDLCQVWVRNGPGGTTGTTLCDITGASTTASTAAPWTISNPEGTKLKIEGANFTDTFSAGCPLGASGGASGTATGLFENGPPAAISMNTFTDDMENAVGAAVDLDGSVSITGEENNEVITMH